MPPGIRRAGAERECREAWPGLIGRWPETGRREWCGSPRSYRLAPGGVTGAGDMDAADLRVFQSVAGTGSMNKAALELNTVQSNVTARIKSLEDEVGFALFERTNRGVTLTAAGRRLLPFAARAATLLDDARRAVADEGTPSGTLTIGSLDTTAALHLSPVLAAYVAAYPAVDLSLRTGTTRELVEQVLDRQLDGAYVCGPAHHPDLLVEP